MYADYEYYATAYGGSLIPTADAFLRPARQASRRLDTATGGKLRYAFPTVETDAEAVKDCACDLTELLYQIDQVQQAAAAGVGYAGQTADGAMIGKTVKTVSSGSESVSYGTGAEIATAATEAAKDRRVMNQAIWQIIRSGLSNVRDANGVNLLYAGPYPAA